MSDTLAMPPSRDDTIARLRALEPQIRQMGVISLSLFGSVARDEAGPDSDIDLFGDLEPDRKFGFAYFGLAGQIGDLMGAKVDFIGRDSLHPMLKDRIVASGLPVF